MIFTENIVYKIDKENEKVTKWYVVGVEKIDNKWYVIVIDKPQSKTKFNKDKIPFNLFGIYAFTDKEEAQEHLKEMNKYEEYCVIYNCSHEGTVRLKGNPYQVQYKLEKIQGDVCPECKNRQCEEEGYLLLEVPYSEYKKKYKDCVTKVGSYKDEHGKKTIEVYIKQ